MFSMRVGDYQYFFSSASAFNRAVAHGRNASTTNHIWYLKEATVVIDERRNTVVKCKISLHDVFTNYFENVE